MRVFLAVHLPRLPLEVFRPNWSVDEALVGAAAQAQAARAHVVVEKEVVIMANGAARAAGVRSGMRRAGASTLAPDAQFDERDAAREAALQRDVGIALMRFSPDVALLDEASVIVEVGASLRLFGGLRALTRQAKAVLDTFGVTARVSVAPTGQGAWLLAHAGNRRLLQLPSLDRALSALPLLAVPEIRPFADWFRGLGCETIADVRRLPRAGLQRRCGEHLLDSIDRAFGTAPELFDWLELPPEFSARIELPDRLEHADGALFAAHRLIAQLCGWLCAKQLAVSAITLSLEYERGRQARAPARVTIALGEPTWHEGHLLRLLKERLHRVTLDAPIIALTLDAVDVEAALPVAADLFPQPGGSPQEHARLIELLVSRLGEDNVLCPAPADDYRPEVANRWVSAAPLVQRLAQKAAPPASKSAGVRGGGVRKIALPVGLPRPTWMLEAPVRLLTRHHRPFYGSSLKIVSPAERIEAGWFDGQLVTRDYFVAQGEDSSYYWIYRERVSSREAEEDGPSWYLHGLFG
jgi:protein ImuB